MNTNQGLPLIAPQVVPALDPGFRPAVLAVRAFRALVEATPGAVPVRIAVEQADGSVFRFEIRVLPESHPHVSGNFTFLEAVRQVSSVVAGGWRISVDGPASLVSQLGRALPRHADRQIRVRTSSASGCSITRWRSSTRAICRPSTRRRGRSAVILTGAA